MTHGYHCPCWHCVRSHRSLLERCWQAEAASPIAVVTAELPPVPVEHQADEPARLPAVLILFTAGLTALALVPVAFALSRR